MANDLIEQLKSEDATETTAYDLKKPNKIFVYKLPNFNPRDAHLKPNSHAWITTTEDVTSDWTKSECEGIINSNSGLKVTPGTATSVPTNSLEVQKTISLYTSDYKGSEDTTEIYVITQNEPLDNDKFRENKQRVYFIENIQPSNETPQNIQGLLNPKNVSVANLIDWRDVLATFPNTSCSFVRGRNLQSSTIQNFKIDIQKQQATNSIEVIGLQSNGLTSSIPISISNGVLIPNFMNIVEDQDKISVFLPWLKNGVALPFKYAKEFLAPKPLSPAFSDEEDWKLLHDLILITYGFSSHWSFVEYVSTGSDAGKIKGDQYIGFAGIQASAIANQDPEMVLNSIIEKYLAESAIEEDSDRFQKVSAFISALSRSISSRLSIAKGLNAFNKVYSPFTLRIFGGITPKKRSGIAVPFPGADPVTSWVVPKSELEIITESKWFGFDPKNQKIISDKAPLLSELKVFKSDRDVTLPILPDVLQKQSISQYPSEIDPSSDKDLKYLVYLPIDPAKLETFFGIDEIVDISLKPGTQVSVPVTAFSRIGTYYEDNQLERLALELGYPNNIISGIIEHVDVPQDDSGYVEFTPGPSQGVGQPITYIKLVINGIVDTRTITGNRPDVSEIVTDWLEGLYPQKAIKNISVSQTGIPSSRKEGNLTINRDDFRVTYDLTHARILNLKYKVTNSINNKESLYKRNTIFDKYLHKKQMDLLSINPGSPDTKITLEIKPDRSIVKIREVIIRSFWGEEITAHIAGYSETIEMINKYDEKIGIFRLLII